jgi:CheY-like chemotaxis protein/HPt (histidine-containing phosphotransfer) domain-containing protein
VLINLANNAVKFTDSGEIVVSSERVQQDPEQITLKFSVSDSGIGLTAEQVSRLFQSFTQADTSTTRKYGGTGLGLTISKRLVEMMGGEIWVESEPGQGAIFSFTAKFRPGSRKEKQRPAIPGDLQGMKVLVVDDNATAREIFQEILTSFSFDVTLAPSGEEGVAEFERAGENHPFELVIMDWKLPDIDGFEASRQIKNHPKIGTPPAIIMVTAYGREEMMQLIETQGLDGFLIKPVNPSMLFDMIMQIFGRETGPQRDILHQKEPDTEALKAIHGASILLVEDNEINQQVAGEILSAAGFRVSIAANGLEAVNAVKDGRYDAVLMDIQMPVMDGYEAARKICELQLEAQNSKLKAGKSSDVSASNLQLPAADLPIIAMTAHAMTGDQEKSLDAGMVDHVTKPIDPGHLFATLLKWVQPREAGMDAEANDPHTEEIQFAGAVADSLPGHQAGPAAAHQAFPAFLAGFDLDEGLKRLQGNHKLYRKLLINFSGSYAGAPDEIRRALASSDYEQAHQLVHSLKGVAANLAADRLLSAAVELEKLVKNVDPGKPPEPEAAEARLDALNTALGQTLESIETLKAGVEDKDSEISTDAAAPVPMDVDKDALGLLRDAAEMGDVTEVVAIVEKIELQARGFLPYKERIVQLAEDFDFDAILKLAVQLENNNA